jgi:hypothetical protein
MIDEVELGGMLDQRETLVEVNDADKSVLFENLG